MKITIYDIAKMCGVSKGTVNRALHNKSGIKPKTKELVLETARRLNYSPDYFATSLATGKTNSIGIILPNVHNEFFAMLYSSLEKQCWGNGFILNLGLSDDDYEKEERYIESFLLRKVEGLIVFPVGTQNKMLSKAVEQGIPVVALLNSVDNLNIDRIEVDDAGAMKETTNILIRAGHKNFVYVDGYRKYTDRYNDHINHVRYKSFRKTLDEAGIPFDERNYIEVEKDYFDQPGDSLLEQIMGMVPTPTAAVCFHDQIAIWLSHAAKKSGYAIPEKLSLTGFDCIRELEYIEPRIATNKMPTDKIASQVMDMLMDKRELKEQKKRKIVLPVEFIQNESIYHL